MTQTTQITRNNYTFTELIEARGIKRGSILWENLRMEYAYHLEYPGRQWGVIWHAAFGFGGVNSPPYDLPLGE